MKRFKKLSKKIIFLCSALIVAIAGIFIYSFFFSKEAAAAWFNEQWLYRQKVELTNSGSTQTDLPVQITLDTQTLEDAGKILSNCNDLRATDANGKLLPFWIEPTTCSTSATKIWVKTNSVPTGGATLYLYYGNPSAPLGWVSTPVPHIFVREISNVKAAWNMDEASWNGTPNEVVDSSGSGIHGVRGNNATTTTGKFGNGGSFNGATGGNYVSAGTGAVSTTNKLTVSTWAYRTGDGSLNDGFNPLVYAQLGSNPWGLYYIFTVPGSDQLRFGVSTGIVGSPASTEVNINLTTYLPINTWHMVTGTWDGSTASIYIDGAFVDSTTSALTLGSTINSSLYFGANTTDGWNTFKGTLDDIRVYDKTLSTAEIADLYGTGGDRQGYVTTNYANKELVRKYSSSVTVGSPGSEEQSPGPVGYWKFDDGQGTTAQDSSSSNLDGTLNNTPTWQPEDRCIAGKCLYFDGTNNENVSRADNTALDFAAAGSFTTQAWVKRDGASSAINYIISKHDVTDDTEDGGYKLYMDASGDFCFGIDDDITWDPDVSACTTGVDFDDDKWHLVTGVRHVSDDKLYLYVDGQQRANTTDTTTLTLENSNIFYIGVDRDGTSNEWLGFIDDVKIYNYARTAAQIKTDYNAGKANASANSGAGAVLGANTEAWLSDGLVGYWKMEETATPSLDSSGNGNSGTWAGNTAAAAGKFGNAISLDGNGDYASITDPGANSALDMNGQITMSAWIKTSSTNDYSGIIHKSDNVGKGYQVTIGSGSNIRTDLYNGTSYSGTETTGLSIEDGAWHLINVTYNGSTIIIYVDGVQKSSSSISGYVQANSNDNSPLLIGYDPYAASRVFNGQIDEVRVYNRALSPKEVSDLYNWAPGPVRYWNFEEGSGNSAIDVSGNGGNGTWNGTGAHWAAGKYGKAGTFNGSDDYVDTGLARNSSSINGDFTASAWVYYKGAAGDGYMPIFADDGSSGGATFFVGKDSGNANIGIEDGTWTANMGLTLASNSWQYITYVKSGTTKYLYVNGILSSTTAATGTLDSSLITIGYENQSGGLYFNGLIDEAKLYNYARTAKQIVQDMSGSSVGAGSSRPAPLGYWKFDEGQGIVANNSGNGGSALNGTLTTMASPATATSSWTQSGKYNRGLLFDGTNDHVAISNGIVTAYPFSMSAWFKYTDSTDNWRNIVTLGNTGNTNEYALLGKVYPSGESSATHGIKYRLSKVDGVEGINILSDVAYNDGQWHHAVGVSAANNDHKLYIDGRLVGSSTTTVTMPTFNQGSIGVLRRSDTIQYWNGSIDEVKVYNYALTASEILTDYNRGSSLILGSTGSNSSYASNAANQEYCVPGDSTSCAAPVGRWDFEEGKDNTCSGGTNDVCDTSGSGNDGTWNGTGTKHWDTGKVGKGGKFNGSDDYVVSADTSFPSGSAARTISAWVKLNVNNTGHYYLAFSYGTLSAQNLMSLGVDHSGGDRNGQWYISQNGSSVIGNVLSTGVWYHLTVTYDGTTYTLYQNGVQVNSGAMTTNTTLSGQAVIGDQIGDLASHTYAWNGQIDQVRVFNYARSAAQVAYDYNKGAPVGHWKLDECQGATAYDSSGNKNNGTITIGATDEATLGTCTTSSTAWGSGATGKRNASLSFDGDDDYVEIADSTALRPANVTLSAWIKPTGTHPNSGRIIEKGWGADPTYASYLFRWCDSSQSGCTSGTYNRISFDIGKSGGYAAVLSNTTDFNDKWTHVAGTYDGSKLRLYINGVLENSTDETNAIVYTATSLFIGRYNGAGSYYYDGQIDDVRVYNYALTATQVKDVMNQGAVFFGPNTGSP